MSDRSKFGFKPLFLLKGALNLVLHLVLTVVLITLVCGSLYEILNIFGKL